VDNHARIIADLVAFHHRPAVELLRFSRWAAWERDILARLPVLEEAQQVTLDRQRDADVEAEETDLIEEYFRGQLGNLGYTPEADRVHIPSGVAADWFNAATGQRLLVSAAARTLKQLHTESRLKVLQPNPSKTHGRGLLWIGEESAADSRTRADIHERIARNAQPLQRHRF
jgi:hypothetical protein